MNKQSQLQPLQPLQSANVVSQLTNGINTIIQQFQIKLQGLVRSAQTNAQQAVSKQPNISNNVVSNLQNIASEINNKKNKLNDLISNSSSILNVLAQQISINSSKMQQTSNVNNQQVQQAAQKITQNPTGKKAMSNMFNLKKYSQQMNVPQLPQQDNGMADQQIQETPQFQQYQNVSDEDRNSGKYQTHAQLAQFLDSLPSAEQATQALLSQARGTAIENEIPSLMESYYQKEQSPENKLLIAQKIFEQLYADKNNQSGTIQGIQTTVAFTTNQIKKIAQNDAKIKTASKKIFNLSKTAQHAGIHNVQMYNADQVHPSPMGARALPQSNYHTIERNKAYNFRIGDRWDIDFQAIWRQNIMDKYSSAYRDADGKWVGGYINKRFQVDSWIPKENNMQLLPGELRKPRPQSQGSMQARMQLYRNNKQKKFNFAEYKIAKNQKNIKTAQQRKQITSKELHHELQSGAYAWPGGYPKYFVTNDGGALSFNTVKNNFAQISDAINRQDNNGWYVFNVDVNWEDSNLMDDHTGQKIQCAYCQDEPKNNIVTAQFNPPQGQNPQQLRMDADLDREQSLLSQTNHVKQDFIGDNLQQQTQQQTKLIFKWAQQTVCQPQGRDVSDQDTQITDEGQFSCNSFRQMFQYLKRERWVQQNPSSQPQIFWKQSQQDQHTGCYVGSRGRIYGDERVIQKFTKAIQGKLV